MDFSRPYKVSFNFRSVGGAIFMALEGPEEREICEQMREEIKERLEEQFFSDASLPQAFALMTYDS